MYVWLVCILRATEVTGELYTLWSYWYLRNKCNNLSKKQKRHLINCPFCFISQIWVCEPCTKYSFSGSGDLLIIKRTSSLQKVPLRKPQFSLVDWIWGWGPTTWGQYGYKWLARWGDQFLKACDPLWFRKGGGACSLPSLSCPNRMHACIRVWYVIYRICVFSMLPFKFI